jgi:hypothetical protein
MKELSVRTLYTYLAGTSNPTRNSRWRMADSLDVPESELPR